MNKELELLYIISEKLVKMKDFQDDGLLKVLLEITNGYLDFSKNREIMAIELASYFPIKTNADLDDDEINVAYIEKPKTLKKNMN